MKIHIALHEPEIPQNTGNIARTCAAIGAELHLIGTLGFSIEEKAVRRAGLDYWDDLKLARYQSLDSFLQDKDPRLIFPATTKAPRNYAEVDYPREVYLLFGKESAGLPEEIIRRFGFQAIRIPMLANTRSLNLSNAVAVIAYEALRQSSFEGLQEKGIPRSFSWD